MDYREITRRFVADKFADASLAIVGGSTARGTRTATSDIDLLLIGDKMLTDGSASFAATYEFEDEVFEVFAYTFDGFESWARSGLAQYRPVIVHMLLEGDALRGSAALLLLRNSWRSIIEAGPMVSPHELDTKRYAATDLLDDLRDATDPVESHIIAFTLFEKIAEVMLLSNRQWIGTGKYLVRGLRNFSTERSDALTEPLIRGDHVEFGRRVEDELSNAGGRVQAGFVR